MVSLCVSGSGDCEGETEQDKKDQKAEENEENRGGNNLKY